MDRRTFIAAITGIAGCTSGKQSYGEYRCESSTVEKVTKLPQPAYGPQTAPNSIIIFEDFACPHCRAFHLNVLPKLKENAVSDSTPPYSFRHFDAPIPVSKWSRRVANAARYVQDTAFPPSKSYFEFAKAAFKSQAEYSWDTLATIATEKDFIESPCNMFNAIENNKYKPIIDRNRSLAFENIGFEGTPAVVVNNKPIENPTFDKITDALAPISVE